MKLSGKIFMSYGKKEIVFELDKLIHFKNLIVAEMTDWEFTIVSLEAKTWQFAAASQEVL